MNNPLVSCLCVTHKKPRMLQRVIECFNNQTYVNRELIIVYEESDEATCTYLHGQTWDEVIKLVKVPDKPVKLSLGELRNLSIREATGTYICQWDDDDWYDSERIAVQIEYILKTNKPACILSRWIVFDSVREEGYLSNMRLWEGSILCRKDIMEQKPYPKENKGEDTEVINYLYKSDLLTIIPNLPELYVYIYHGTNTWEEAHFTEIFNASTKLSPNQSAQILDITHL